MRAILFGLIALSLGCGGASSTSAGATTLSGAYSLSGVDRNPKAAACYTSPSDPSLIVYLARATLTFDAAGTGTLNSFFETRRNSDASLVSTSTTTQAITYVRAGSTLTITSNGSPGNGQVDPGDATLWTKQPWCTGLKDASATQRFDFAR
ncbi:MAG: hypothetical protein ACR2NS_09275 [Gemmatimonadaceae bacterium]